jgi:hypothetical protein
MTKSPDGGSPGEALFHVKRFCPCGLTRMHTKRAISQPMTPDFVPPNGDATAMRTTTRSLRRGYRGEVCTSAPQRTAP